MAVGESLHKRCDVDVSDVALARDWCSWGELEEVCQGLVEQKKSVRTVQLDLGEMSHRFNFPSPCLMIEGVLARTHLGMDLMEMMPGIGATKLLGTVYVSKT